MKRFASVSASVLILSAVFAAHASAMVFDQASPLIAIGTATGPTNPSPRQPYAGGGV